MKKNPKLPRKQVSRSILGAIGTFLALIPLAVHAQTQSTWSGASGDNNWQTSGNWSANSLAAEFDKDIGNRRINIGGGSASTTAMVYSSAEGTTTINSSVLALLVGQGGQAGMRITGGSLTANTTGTTVGTHGSFISNGQNATLSIEGGAFAANFIFFINYSASGNTAATLSLSGSGSATFDTLSFGRTGAVAQSTSSATVNLNGGTLAANTIASAFTTTSHATSRINFNGGTLQARQNNATFVANNVDRPTRLNVRNGGAVIDTNNFDITIPGPFVHSDVVDDDPIDGGLVKNSAGILTLSGNHTYTGPTTVNGGTLIFNGESLLKLRTGNQTNTIGGSGTVEFNSLFRIDVANATPSGTWALVNVDTLTETFGGGFGLAFVDGPTFTTGDNITYTSGEYSFSKVTGVLTRTGASAPEIDITRGINPVASGGTDTVTGTAAGLETVLTYAVTNIGDALLSITGPATIGSATNVIADVTTQPEGTLAASAFSDLVVSFTPTAIGPWSFTVSLPNDDADENPYTWTVSGNAIQLEQELNITRGPAPIANNATDTISGTLSGVSVPLTYTLTNAGLNTLNITGSATVSNQSNVTATLTTQPSATITSGGTSNLAVSLTPTVAGAWSFKLNVPNDDSNENPYVWTVAGNALLNEPEISITRASLAIPVGSTDPVSGNIVTALPYLISNTGAATLTIGSVVVSGANNCVASVTTAPAASINPANSSTLVVSVSPTATGAWSFNVSVPNNDSNENPYTWTVIGNASNLPASTTIFTETFQDGIFDPEEDTTTYNTGEVYRARTDAGTLENVLKPGEVEGPTAAREAKFDLTGGIGGFPGDGRILTRPFAAQSLANNGDRLRLSYKLRLDGANFTLLRTGLFNVTNLPESYVWGHDWNNSFANNSTFGLVARTPAVVNGGYYSFLRDNSTAVSGARYVAPLDWTAAGSAPTRAIGTNLNTPILTYDIDTSNSITYQVVYEVERVSSSEAKTLMTLSSTDQFNATTVHMMVPGTRSGSVVTDFNGAYIQVDSAANTDAMTLFLDDLKLEKITGAAVPNLAVTRDSNPVADGGSDAVSPSQAAVASTLNYLLTNSGAAPLAVGSPVSITSLLNCTATVTTPPASSIAASGGTSALVVSVTPSAPGAWSFAISFTSSDAQNPYNWTVSGTATAPGGNPYDEWAADAGLIGPDAARTATPFNDGVANLLKFGFNMNGAGPDVSMLTPTSGTAGLPVWTLVGSGPARVLQVEYIARKGADLSYFPEVSSTLIGAFTPMSGTPSINVIDATFDRVIVTHPADPAVTPKLFGRVRIVDPE